MDAHCPGYGGAVVMPTGTWFDAVTDALQTAWADDIAQTGITSNKASLLLDLYTGDQSFVVSVNDSPRASVPVLASSAIVAVPATSGTLGFVTVTPVAVGSAVIYVGPFLGYEAIEVAVSVIDTRPTSAESIQVIPDAATLDIAYGGKTFQVLFAGKPVADIPLTLIGTAAHLVETNVDEDGKFRVEPLSVGSVVVKVGEIAIPITIIQSVPLATVTTIRLRQEITDVHVGAAPFDITILDQALRPLPGLDKRVECYVSTPGILKVARDSLSGVFHVHARGVGAGKITFVYMVNGVRYEAQRRFEVLP